MRSPIALQYDYDIRWLPPNDPGPASAPEDRFVALFRSEATAAALRGADPDLQAFFTESGFGLTTYDSGAPSGYFPLEDLSARNDITERLTENLGKFKIKGDATSGISLADFLASEMAARPIDISALTAKARVRPLGKADPELGIAAENAPDAREKGDWCKRSLSLNPLLLGGLALTLVLLPFVNASLAGL